MYLFKRQYALLFKRIGWLMCLYTLCRVLFLWLNRSAFSTASVIDLLYAFVLGLRFDLSVIAIINMLYVLCALLPQKLWDNLSYQKFLKWFFVIPNALFLWFNVVDLEYYKFIGRRTNFEILGIANDATDQALNLAGKFWYLVVIGGILTWVFVAYLPQYQSVKALGKDQKRWNPFLIFSALFTTALCILAFRGGLQEKPLRINQAFVQNNSALGNLVLNTPFTFLTTVDAVGTHKVDYISQNKELLSLVSRDTELSGFRHNAPQNVVVIIVESLSAEYMGLGNSYEGYTPFLDSLGRAGFCMQQHFANGRESIDAVPAVTASIPKLMDEPYITSMYQSNLIEGLGTIANTKGYKTSFFHGAKNGSMGFEGFSQIAGYQHYFGLNEYPNKADYDGHWGIFDEPFLQFFADRLSQENTPFVSTVFTLSSHMPYTIPEQHKGRFKKGPLEVHETIGYADYALKRFFEKASKQPWFKNTLFIITGDHTQQNHEAKYANELGAYRVPLIVFHGGNEENKRLKSFVHPQKITQHADIMPSIADFLNIRLAQPLPFGESIFRAGNGGLALQYNEGIFRMVLPDKYIKFDGDKVQAFGYNLAQGKIWPLASDLSKNLAIKELQAFIQYHHNGLIDNSWIENQVYNKTYLVERK